MKPLKKGRILVRANANQKEELVYGTLKLYIPNRRMLNENGRIAEPTLCEVVYSYEKEIEAGDVLVLGHNSINNPAWMISEEDGIKTLCLPVDRWILGKLGDRGELIPLFGNTVCKRISESPVSSLIITPDAFKKTEQNKVIVLAVAPDVTDIHSGDTGIIHKYADYEIHYSVNGEERSSVIVTSSDIVATMKHTEHAN